MLINDVTPLKFKPILHHFSWLYNVAPCFAVHASKINIITDPTKFYDTLCNRFRSANRRISIASLYIGTGKLEQELLDITKYSVWKKGLELSVLLDYQRGMRGAVNSRSLLQGFIDDMPDQCVISMYQTPRLQGSWSKALPARYNELVGLQHMKLYIADDSVILSGANCSNDYFEKRQDRYIEIEDENLADFYCELIDEVSSFSKRCTKDGVVDNKQLTKAEMGKEVNEKIGGLIARTLERQKMRLASNEDNDKDTWVFPLIQMGEFNITQDQEVTRTILATAPKGSHIRLASGYFNLTEDYTNTLLKICKSSISLLMAHPNANGFMGAPGPAGGIPHAYSFLAQKFWHRVVNSNQASRIQLLEYERPEWTFHAKGLWYYPPMSNVPYGTIVGSANLGERSVRRDLEAQCAIFTVSKDLQSQLHEECCKLHDYAADCTVDLHDRRAPLWVRATVGIFRSYF